MVLLRALQVISQSFQRLCTWHCFGRLCSQALLQTVCFLDKVEANLSTWVLNPFGSYTSEWNSTTCSYMFYKLWLASLSVNAQFRSTWTKFGPMQRRSPFIFAMHGTRAIADSCVLQLPLEPWDDSWKHVGYEQQTPISRPCIQSPMASTISWAAKSVPRK